MYSNTRDLMGIVKGIPADRAVYQRHESFRDHLDPNRNPQADLFPI